MKTRFHKFTAWLLTVAMLMTFIPSFTLGVSVAAETTEKNITLGTTALKSNVYFGTYQQSSLGSTRPTEGTEGVDWIKCDTATYNGQGPYYSKDPIKWRVLSRPYEILFGKSVFLLSDKNLDVVRYHEESEGVTWETSTIRSWLNGYDAESNQNSVDYSNDNFIDAAFGAAEQNIISETTVINDDNSTYSTEGGNNTTDKVFLLSIEEAQNILYFINDYTRKAVNTAYVCDGGKDGSGDQFGAGVSDYWWLRSPGGWVNYAADVNPYGNVHSSGFYVDRDFAVRPALNLNLSSVLFTSAAKGGKSSAAAVGGGAGILKNADLSTLTDNDGYKLTLLDNNRNFEISDTSPKTAKKGDSISFNYYNSKTGSNEYISAMIVGESGEVIYYGQLAQPTAESGTAAFVVPSDIEAGTYTLKVFNEQINGDCKTDLSSEFVNISLNVPLTVTLDANGGSVTSQNIELVDGKIQNLPTPTREGYIFNGWYDSDNNEITLNTVFTQDTTIYAKWSEKIKVTFDANGGGCTLAYAYVDDSNKLSSLPTATKVNCNFIGWYDSHGNEVTTESVILESTVIYAKYEAINNQKIDLTFLCGTEDEKTIILSDYLPLDAEIDSMSITQATTVYKTTPKWTSGTNNARIAIIPIKSLVAKSDTLKVEIITSNYETITFNIEVSLINHEICSYDSTTNYVDIMFIKTGTYTVIFADYDDDRLANVETQEITITETGNVPVSITKGFTLDTGDKIMLWKDMTTLVPLCEAYIVE